METPPAPISLEYDVSCPSSTTLMGYRSHSGLWRLLYPRASPCGHARLAATLPSCRGCARVEARRSRFQTPSADWRVPRSASHPEERRSGYFVRYLTGAPTPLTNGAGATVPLGVTIFVIQIIALRAARRLSRRGACGAERATARNDRVSPSVTASASHNASTQATEA